MKKIRILRIITRLNVGGPATHAILLTKEFNNAEFESRLICGSVSAEEGDMSYLAELYGVKPVLIPQLRREVNPLSDIVAFWRLFDYMRKYKPDIVHTHTAKAGLLGRLAAVLANIPVRIHTFHGNIFHGYFNKMNTRIFIFIERVLAKFTNRIIAISQRQKAEIVEKYGITEDKRCSVIRLGFDLEKFLNSANKKNILRKKYNFREDNILIGTIGRLTSIKNHKMFIDAVDYINRAVPADTIHNMKFAIVGDGELKNELFEYVRYKGLDKKIFFTGWVKAIDEVYADFDVVALTSINEGTPVSLIEAMASSKPVISTDVGGVKDVVGDIGILVKDNDYIAMGERILELASSAEKREELGRRGRNFVKEVYSKEHLVNELGNLYRDLISNQREGRK